MKWLVLVLIVFNLTCYTQIVYQPEVLTYKNPNKKSSTTVISNRGRMIWQLGSLRRDSLKKILLDVDKPTIYKGGIKKLQKSLRDSILFKDKNDVRHKDISYYKIRLLIDSAGIVKNIDFFSGKYNDLFYPQLISELIEAQNWRPAKIGSENVAYLMPLVVMLKPRKFKKTYKIKIGKPLKLKTIF